MPSEKSKYVQIAVSVILPLVIFILGIRLTSTVESLKNQTTIKHDWTTKWADEFFDSHKKHNNRVALLLSKLKFLKEEIKKGVQNEQYGITLQNHYCPVKIFLALNTSMI